MKRPRTNAGSFALTAPLTRSAPACAVCGQWLAAAIVLTVRVAPAQEALRSSLAGEAAAEARHLKLESLPYTFKIRDFRLRVTPSVGMDWNDNINASKTAPQQDFILKPMLQFGASYPVTQRNLLQITVGVGYNEYLRHSSLSTWFLQSGSELSFDIFIKDLLINLHDRFQFMQDSVTEAAVAGTARYGNINNTAGLLVTWDLQDVTLSLGYDHQNVMSPAAEFQYQDHASELFTGRVGLRFNPRITAGVEATASFTAYNQTVLNDNKSYSVGIYADWQPGSYFRVQPRVGYTIFQFQSTSRSIQTSDLNSWYADLTVSHQFSEAVSYSLSAGHEVRLGIQSDAIEDSYFRPTIDWKIIKNLSLQTGLSYEHGDQGAGNVRGNLTETYDWFGGTLGLSHPLTDRLMLALNYRLTLRSSSIASREYAQNVVGLQLSYQTQ